MKRTMEIRGESLGEASWRCWLGLRALVFGVTLIVANAALAGDPDLARAEQLVREGKHQEAYDLLDLAEWGCAAASARR